MKLGESGYQIRMVLTAICLALGSCEGCLGRLCL